MIVSVRCWPGFQTWLPSPVVAESARESDPTSSQFSVPSTFGPGRFAWSVGSAPLIRSMLPL